MNTPMERRELYEPEDIEQLLIERSYDELLEEERAFVLRHLSGRDEYEAMRALLLKVHDDDGTAEPIDAEPSVRAHVLDVFRAEQRPQWRIWLNSVHAFLLPKEASAMWRPALALGSVALVVFFVVNSTLTTDEATSHQLAEVKQVPAPSPEEKNQRTPPPQADQPATPAEEQAAVSRAASATTTRSEAVAANEDMKELVAARDEQASIVAKQEAEQPAPPSAAEEQLDLAKADDAPAATFDVMTKFIPATGSTAIALDSSILSTGAASHIVTSNELTYNFSATNATQLQPVGTLSTQSATRFLEREKAKKSADRKRTTTGWSDSEGEATADAGTYIDLLRAAW